MINIFLSNIINSTIFLTIGRYLLIILPIVIPLLLFMAFWMLRFRWLTMKYVEAQQTCMLEIKLPKEILKSPAGMEIFFSHLNQSGAGNYGEAFIDGRTRPWFSCELVSTGGVVRFFVWCSQIKFKNLVESQLYAQYPNIEILEAEDYTKDFYYDLDKYPLFALQYALTKPDPFPIKTYIDYGLDEDPKEEYKVDPITSVIEFLGSLKKGENVWIQILLQKHEPESWKHGVMQIENPKKPNFMHKIWMSIFGKSKDLKSEVDEEIKKIKKSTLTEAEKGSDEKVMRFPNPTKGQLEVIAALERSSTKTPFDCMIRSVYITEKGAFIPGNITAMVGSLKQYGSLKLNGFKPGTISDPKDEKKDIGRIFPFYQRILDEETRAVKRNLLHAYKLRSFFQRPFKNYKKSKPFVLTTEELATIFHFPSGMVSQTPTLSRVGSKKSQSPADLPV